ncbi:copper-containing nitrite reductase [Algibacter lectus]|uniref:Copper-containing nitrite reductase n=2 Tax=Algibacter TaxID=261827 RepID=A0A090W055_9FLAO|nr:copper-containing nitrite reductase [Algibacter lectus]
MEFKVEVPGTFILVDHSIFRAFNKGALGMLKVEGEKNKTLYSGEIRDDIYLPEGPGIQNMPTTDEIIASEIPAKSFEEQMEFGKQAYMQTCFACHQGEGQGIPHAFPPLAKSDYLNADVDRAIGIVLHGKTGEITVNGETYNSVMTRQMLSSDEIANVLTYVYNSWGNSKKVVTKEMVDKVKNSK